MVGQNTVRTYYVVMMDFDLLKAFGYIEDVDVVQGGGYQQAQGALHAERTPRNSHSHVSI